MFLPGLQKATQIAAGANHSIILGEDGNAYTFGSNEFGQCGGVGVGDMDIIPIPTKVKLPKNARKVVKISGGYAHTIIQDEGGAVYSFGQNVNGQLGLGLGLQSLDSNSPKDVLEACRVDPLPNSR